MVSSAGIRCKRVWHIDQVSDPADGFRNGDVIIVHPTQSISRKRRTEKIIGLEVANGFPERGQHSTLSCRHESLGNFATRCIETAIFAFREQQAVRAIGHYEFELLRLPTDNCPEIRACNSTSNCWPALWKAIRDFEPDYLFCPPLPADALCGVHNDHVTIAEAVRRVAYLINVPHAFTPEYPADETIPVPRKTPVV